MAYYFILHVCSYHESPPPHAPRSCVRGKALAHQAEGLSEGRQVTSRASARTKYPARSNCRFARQTRTRRSPARWPRAQQRHHRVARRKARRAARSTSAARPVRVQHASRAAAP
eukprot:4283615-Prymnesium_polylepis.1